MEFSLKTKLLTYLLIIFLCNNLLPAGAVFAQVRDTHSSSDMTLPTNSLSPMLLADASVPHVELSGQSQSSASVKHSPVVQKLEKTQFRSDEDIKIAVSNTQDQHVQIAVEDAEGKTADVSLAKIATGTDTVFDLTPRTQFRPGKYKVIITDSDGKKSEQDFTWGVLAINTNKSMYQPHDTANLSMAVLDEEGKMVCDAKVTLEIKNEALGVDDTLSTENGKIKANDQCQSHNFSLDPDYGAIYQVNGKGTYDMTLTARTKNGEYSINDSFQVEDSIPFDVERVSATRIYPPNNYPVKLNITANQDFDGIVTESVPESFTITAAPDNSYDNMQTLYLDQKDDPAAVLKQDVLGTNADPMASASGLVLPFNGSYPITEGFGAEMTDPDLRLKYLSYGLAGHDGADFGVPIGTPIDAVDDGTVLLAGPGDYGITVIIQHSWGKTYYGHLSSVNVEKDAHVTKGQQIGVSGNTGESTGPHLHFGMKPNNPDMNNGYKGKIDPLPYFGLLPTAPVASNITLAHAKTIVLGASTSADLGPDNQATSSADTPKTASSSATSQPAFTVLENQLKEETLQDPIAPTKDKVKVIQWHVSLKKGEKTTLSYQFKAPQISPQFYLLGPARFYPTGASQERPLFQEQRQWQIAADAIGTAWYNNGTPYGGYAWQYRKQITINHAQVAATQSNFPVLVSLPSDSDLNTHVTSSNEILFTDANGNKLSHEIEKYDSTTGALIAWVNVPNLSSSSDTTLYLYYGNAAASNQQDIANVWSNSYTSVWHLKEDPTTTCNSTHEFCDSATNNHGDAQGSMTAADRITGQIGYGTNLNGTNDYISTTNAYTNPQSITISAWFRTNTTASRKIIGFEINQTGTGSLTHDREIYTKTTGQIAFGYWTGFSASTITSTNTYNDNNWHFAEGTIDTSLNKITLYIDGAQVAQTTSGSQSNYTGYWRMGNYVGWDANGYFPGQLDEVRVASSARSLDWVTTEYNNQNTPSTFYTLGTEETKNYAPSPDQMMRHGQFFNTSGVIQPFTF